MLICEMRAMFQLFGMLCLSYLVNVVFSLEKFPEDEFYKRVTPAETKDCLSCILALPLSQYEFKYDSIKGRRHLGSVGPTVQAVLPTAVSYKPSRAFPGGCGNGNEVPSEEIDVPIVDKSVIFMYNVGAIQEIAHQIDQLTGRVLAAVEKSDFLQSAAKEIKMLFEMEASEKAVQEAKLQEIEAEAAEHALHLEESIRRASLEAEKLKEKLEFEERETAHEIELARLNFEANVELEKTKKFLEIEEESFRHKELSRLEVEKKISETRFAVESAAEEQRIQVALTIVDAERESMAASAAVKAELEMSKLKMEAEQRRLRVLEVVDTTFTHLSVPSSRLTPTHLALVTTWILALLATYFLLKEVLQLIRNILEASMCRPSLVQRWIKGRATRLNESECCSGHFTDVQLPDGFKKQIISLATSTKNARSNGAPYRNLLLYGPPGTGKTMVATRLAAVSGSDCAVMSGGDIGPLGKNAVTELHKLFKWAKQSRKGLLLFIDEAEAFLSKRSSVITSQDTRDALNSLLHQTGSCSQDFMLVLATNRAEDFDEAVLDRMDDALCFALPKQTCREYLLRLYYNKYIAPLVGSPLNGNRMKEDSCITTIISKNWWFRRSGKTKHVLVDKAVTQGYMASFAEDIEGFSGREVSKLILSIRNCAFGLDSGGILTKGAVSKMVSMKIKEHQRKTELLMPRSTSKRFE